MLFGGLAITGLVIRSLGKRMAAHRPGSAVLAQSRGFERYIATAEANQIRWEEAQQVFSRFLPFAIVFGLADRWAQVFEEVAAAAAAAGHVIASPTWYAGAWTSGGFSDVASSMDSFSTVAAGTFVSTSGPRGRAASAVAGASVAAVAAARPAASLVVPAPDEGHARRCGAWPSWCSGRASPGAFPPCRPA